MKKNWTYKKLGEVCEIYQPKTISTEMLCSDGEFLVYGANGVIGRYNQYNHEESEVLMTCRGATCGTINISEPHSWINGNAMVIHPKTNDTFHSRTFLVYLLRSLDLSTIITGCAQPQITRMSLAPLTIPVPPLATQSRIVSELDLLQSIIDKQKAQLKELDNLAQAVFYDMFGDPVENEKGWERIPFESSIQKVKYTTKLQSKDYLDSGKYPIISQEEEYISGYWNNDEDLFRVVSPVVIFGDHTRILKYVDFSFVLGADGVKIFLPISAVTPWYLYYFLKSSNIPSLGYSRHYKLLKELTVPIPPLDLQQSFTAKIESIEKHKAAITKSIEETQKLFDYTMDKYFGE